MKPAIIYAREIAGENVMEQIERCRQYASAHDCRVMSAFVDLRVEGPAYRLGLRAIMDMIEAGDIEVVIASAPETMSKDAMRIDSIREDLQGKNCELRFASNGIG